MNIDEINKSIKKFNKDELIEVQNAISDRLMVMDKVDELISFTKSLNNVDLHEIQEAIKDRFAENDPEKLEEKFHCSISELVRIAEISESLNIDHIGKLTYGFGEDFRYFDTDEEIRNHEDKVRIAKSEARIQEAKDRIADGRDTVYPSVIINPNLRLDTDEK